MREEKGVHDGHRDRVIKKFINYPQSFCEHEILEALLFFAVPRVDTNPLAHRLIDSFGSLAKVFNASAKELMTVDGVGEKVASFIKLVSVAKDMVDLQNDRDTVWLSPDKIKKLLVKELGELSEERLVMFMLDANYKMKQKLFLGKGKKDSVEVDALKLGEALVAVKPKYVLIAHNHPSGMVLPSEQDDRTTERVAILCVAHGVELSDHIIVSGNDTFSYFSSGRLQIIKKNSIANKMLNHKEY